MNLKSFGCSFIFGSDLADDGRDLPVPTPSQFTWPALLAKHLTMNYNCYARPGSGNLQILERILNQATENSDLFVIGWTWIDRFDYYNRDNSTKYEWHRWNTIMPIDTNKLAKIYYRDLHSEYQDKFTCLSYIKLAIDTLNQKNIPFIMTYMDDLLFDQHWHTTTALIDLQNYVKPYMTTFNGQTFLEYSRANNYPISPTLHPLEEAHSSAGNYIINTFKGKK
jgi:hypothetical protein